MFKTFFEIITAPFTVPARVNRIAYINRLALNLILFFILCFILAMFHGIDLSSVSPRIIRYLDILKTDFDWISYAFFFSILYLFIVTFWRLSIARLHDMNCTGLLSLFYIVPNVNGIFWLILLIAPGSEGKNNFGEQTPNSKLDYALSTLSIIAIIAIILSATYMLFHFFKL